MRNYTRLMRAVASLLIVTTPFLPIHAYANGNSASEAGREAQVLANDLVSSFKSAPGGVNNGNISFPTLENGQFQNGGGTINVNDLFPGTSSSNSDPSSYYFPDGNPNIGELEGVYNDNNGMDSIGGNAKSSLWSDANSGNPTISGAAYKVLLDATNQSKPDFSNDPLMNLSKKTYEDIDVISEGFGDCSAETIINNNTIKAHIPDYRTCERITDKSADCEVLHEYDAEIIKYHSGPFNIKPCGDDCIQLWIGKVGDNYWSGWCSVYEESTQVRVDNPDAIISATLEYAKWDDYMQVLVGPPGAEQKVWQGPNSNFPPETGGACELSTSWQRNPNIDVTSHFKNAKAGDVISFKIRVSVAGKGEGYGRIKIKYDRSKAVFKDTWTPQSCLDAAVGIKDGFASGEFTCIQQPTDVQGTGCVVKNGYRVCEDMLSESPLPGIPKLCEKVRVKADYDFNKGQMECWTDPQGVEHCPENEGGNVNSCQALEENPQCGFISSQCVDGAKGDSGVCYVQEDTFDCGTDVDVPTLDKETNFTCGGPIKCMGDECLDVNKTQSTDFARAAALLNAAQFMTQDMACTGTDGNDNPTGTENVICKAFGGDPGECKKAVGGAQDCCEKPSGLSMGDYLTLMMSVPKLDGAIMSLENGSAIKGAYQAIRDPAISGWTEITKPFTSYIENITGAIDNFTKPITDLAKEAIQALKDEITKITSKALGNASASGSAGVPAGASEGMMEQMVGQQAASVLSGIMAAYTAYVVAMMIIQIVWKCEEEEFELNAKRALNSCTKVGSYCKSKVLGACIEKREAYCCFSSPLSRIIQEQVRPQLGMSFGPAKAPQCEGIPLERLAEIDWTQVNLDEWLALLRANGHFDDPAGMTLDRLTGSGSAFDVDGTRLNAQERAEERLKGSDLDKTRKDAGDSIFPDTGALGY
ncbi:conjugal transfer mating pair stabilization protein TraN [Vibrio parahaemolyticus]|uniref:conjugal transfer mating pair stabilization protein TraN n=1 Tax=Vibrio parahaemolyticus TaxID=670 RepID=UPI0011236923|nr:conjugal transfer mating pair stabilization protein TraN [Vibrio parahaemolyticus]MBM5276756.1 conjugal transfer mating pair stabilization protein TraN [Vibrio parahaemolyticus]MCF9039676.1 conjugal transfer mating pair stabilization protein TraN [Vibrio parahaemolyticus]TOI60599.1 conjugal transfer protein TraN [Vibrio parahaemolyticus]